MKNIIHNLNKAFDNRVRLGIMSLLMIHDWVDFGELKDALDLTDGNLASHLMALEKSDFVLVRKGFIGRKPNTSYAATETGKKAFQEHLDALESLIRNSNVLS